MSVGPKSESGDVHGEEKVPRPRSGGAVGEGEFGVRVVAAFGEGLI